MVIEYIMIGVVGSGVVVTSVGLIRLWVKNGREASKRNGIIDTKLEGIMTSQTEIKDDTRCIRGEMSEHKEHCASITSGFKEKINALEKRGYDY